MQGWSALRVKKRTFTILAVALLSLFATLSTRSPESSERIEVDLGPAKVRISHQQAQVRRARDAVDFYASKEAGRTYRSEVFLESISDIDLKTGTFTASGRARIVSPPQEDNGLALQGFRFVNSVSEDEFISSDDIKKEDGDRLVRTINFSGPLRFSPELGIFPFDEQTLNIAIENRLESADSARIIPYDFRLSEQMLTKGSEGYRIGGRQTREEVYLYNSDLARSDSTSSKLYSDRAVYQLKLGKSFFAASIRYVIPFIVVIAVNCASLVIPLKFWEVKLALPPTALLTLVFMQSSYQEKIAQGYNPTILDVLYLSGYALCLATLAISIIETKRVAYSEDVMTDELDENRVRRGIHNALLFSLILSIAFTSLGLVQVLASRGLPTISIVRKRQVQILSSRPRPVLESGESVETLFPFNPDAPLEVASFNILDKFLKLSSAGDYTAAQGLCDTSLPECGQTSLFSRTRNAAIVKIIAAKKATQDSVLAKAIVLFQLADGTNSIELKEFTVDAHRQRIVHSRFMQSLSASDLDLGADIFFVPDPPSRIRSKPNGNVICTIERRGSFVKAVESRYKGWLSTSDCGASGYIHESQVLR